MADQNNYNNLNYGSTSGRIDQNASSQDTQARGNMEVITGSSVLLHAHANYEGMFSTTGEEVSEQKYNVIIGVLLLYGFVVNAILCFIFPDPIMKLNPILVTVMYLVFAAIGWRICRSTRKPAIGFIGYNMIVVPMGIMITPILQMYDLSTVRYAFCVMGVCTMIMIGLAEMYPQFFRSLGLTIFACFITGMVGEIIVWCLGLPTGIFDFAFVGILMLAVGYDWAIAQNRRKTVNNAIFSAFMIYVDLIHMLIRLIRILASTRKR